MNQIEIWFGIINRKLLKRKSYLSTEELEASILRFMEQYNLTAHPFRAISEKVFSIRRRQTNLDNQMK